MLNIKLINLDYNKKQC